MHPNFTPMVATECQGCFIVDADVVCGNVEHTQLSNIVQRVESDLETKRSKLYWPMPAYIKW